MGITEVFIWLIGLLAYQVLMTLQVGMGLGQSRVFGSKGSLRVKSLGVPKP